MNSNLDYRFNSNTNIIDINACIQISNTNLTDFLGKGLQGKVFKIKSNKCGIAVVKQFNSDKSYDRNREIYFLKKIKEIIEKNICPNFIYMYKIFNNKILLEYADGNLDDFIKIKEYPDEIFTNIFFQLLTGILVLQKKLLVYHNDLYPKNIFYKKISTNKYKYFKYIINDKVYWLPNCGYLFIIADFGQAQGYTDTKYNKYDQTYIKNAIDNNYDFNILSTYYNRIIVDNLSNLFETLDICLNKFNLKSNSNIKKYIDTTLKTIKLSTTSDYKINKSLYRSVLYYLIENNLIDWKKYKDKFMYFVPSKLLSTIFLSTNPIDKILEENFKQFNKPNDINETNFKEFIIKY